jgi:uncharacterized LabA/DUF88 family protein
MQRGNTLPERAAPTDPAPDDNALGALLVDFDNFMPPARTLKPSEASHLLQATIRSMLEKSPGLATLNVRLYGGWRSSGLLSRRGSEVAGLLRSIDPFPIPIAPNRLLRGGVELAFGLIGHNSPEFEDTYRVRGSAPRIRLSESPVPSGCVSQQQYSCPARILKRFTSSRGRVCPVDTCAVTSEAAFLLAEQKMVDTLLSCDLIELAHPSSQYFQVAVASGDTDFVPPLVYASRRTTALLHLITTQPNWNPGAAQILRSHNVHVSELESTDGTQRLAG